MLHLSPAVKYFLYRQAADMRKGFDGLCGLVNSQLQLDALSGAVFIFMNRRRNQVKLLLWEGDGLALYHKRLEKGTYELPRESGACTHICLDWQQLQFILQGVVLRKISYRPRFQKTA